MKTNKKEYGKVIIIASMRLQTMKIRLNKYEDQYRKRNQVQSLSWYK